MADQVEAERASLLAARQAWKDALARSPFQLRQGGVQFAGLIAKILLQSAEDADHFGQPGAAIVQITLTQRLSRLRRCRALLRVADAISAG